MALVTSIPPLVPREEFPLLRRSDSIAYLDSAASSQKHASVLDAWREFYETRYANIHRGVYALSEAATEAYENARARVAAFLRAKDANSIVFVRNATEAINLVARSWGAKNLGHNDAVVLTLLEHHSNIVPWQMLAQERGFEIRFAGLTVNGDLDLEHMGRLVDERVKLICATAAANTLGSKVSVKHVVALAKEVSALTMIDAAQAAPHFPIDVQDWDCDFLAITGHKLYGPDGIGALYAKPDLLQNMPPFMGGGGMIATVTTLGVNFADPPRRFEAGTPAIGEAVGLAAALDFMNRQSWPAIERHEQLLTDYALAQLSEIPGVKIIGRPKERVGIISLAVDGAHPHDVGTLLGDVGVCVRAGHHCAQPLMAALDVVGTVRASFGLYNSSHDVDRLVDGLTRARQILSK